MIQRVDIQLLFFETQQAIVQLAGCSMLPFAC